MKIIKNPILTFIIGGILFSSIAVFAVNTISADKITYTDKNNVERTVDKVLDDLYTLKNTVEFSKFDVAITPSGGNGQVYIQNNGYTKLNTNHYQSALYSGTVYFSIYGYTNSGCTEGKTELLKTTTSTQNIEEYDITNYQCMQLRVECTAIGSTQVHFYFDNISLSK